MHFDYLVPFNSELDIPYRANKKLKDKIEYIFKHPTLPKKNRDRFIKVSTSGSKQLVNDMAVRAIAMTKYYINNPQQFGHSMENIYLQILVRMWRQTYKHMIMQSKPDREEWEYLSVKLKTLSIDNGLWDELIRVVMDNDYIQSNDDMIKVRKGIGLRDRKNNKTHNPASMKEGSPNFEYLCSIYENEIGSLL